MFDPKQRKNYPKIPGLNLASDIYIKKLSGSSLKRVTPKGGLQVIPDWIGNEILYMEYDDRANYMGFTLITKYGKNRRRIGRNFKDAKFIPPGFPK